MLLFFFCLADSFFSLLVSLIILFLHIVVDNKTNSFLLLVHYICKLKKKKLEARFLCRIAFVLRARGRVDKKKWMRSKIKANFWSISIYRPIQTSYICHMLQAAMYYSTLVHSLSLLYDNRIISSERIKK